MAKKQKHSSARDFHSSSSKLVCPVSLVSILICTASLVRVEIINKRVHDLEDSVTDVQQIQNLNKVSTGEETVQRPSSRVDSVGKFDTKERRDETAGHIGRTRRFSSGADKRPGELTVESVRSEINKTLNSLMSRSFCSPKEQICVQGPPGIQGPKGSRGRRGLRGESGRKGSRGNRGEPGPHGKQGIIGPPGPKGEQGMKGLLGSKGEAGLKGDQGIMGPLGLKGEQGMKGIPGPKGDQGVRGSIGPKGEQGVTGPSGPRGEKGVIGVRGHRGEQGIIGPPGAKGKQGIMGPPGPKGQQGYIGPPGQKGKQGIMGFPGPRGIPGAMGKPGEHYSPPKVVVSPMKQTIMEKHTVVFHCSVSGNPKPTVTWLDESGTSLRNNDGRLEVRDVTLDDAGEYTCIGRNLRGTTSQTSILIVEGVFQPTNGARGRYGTIQKFTVPITGRYLIKAWGARGGTHSYNYGDNPGTYYGGKGAYIEGKFRLAKGTVMNIVVGQRGGNSVEVKGGQETTRTAAQLGLSVEDNAGTGGGGGSFVYTTSNMLLLAAGGGGGASGGYNGVDGQAGTSGTSSVGKESSQVRKGGTGGQPGECNTAGASYHGGVGAGWYAQGCSSAVSNHGEGGGSRAQGWIGGQAGGMNSGNNGGPSPGAVGGFGGGGGGAEDNGASGGGGGYSGGGSGTHEKQAGGGGGSYCSGDSCSGVTGGNINDDGLVQIVVISD